jgi:creatinine deaminase
MKRFITQDTSVTEKVLNVISHLPTKSPPAIVADKFLVKLSDRNIMRIAVLLAQKSYDEGVCHIGGAIIDNNTRQIVGKGHNTLVQHNDHYSHCETSAIRDAGRQDSSNTMIFHNAQPL